MNWPHHPALLLLALITALPSAGQAKKGKVPWGLKVAPERPTELDDASRMNRTKVAEIWPVPTEPNEAEEQLRKLLGRARKEGLPVSIAGARHSMGGHSIASGGVVVDMRPFQHLTLLDGGRILRASAGATWAQILAFLDPHGLSVGVMQSNNSFSVGGSLSVNCHGWQYGRPPIASTVQAFRLLKADGSIVRCSRQENADLFRLALGGYGLFGILLDADLRTVPNHAYRLERKAIPIAEAIAYYNDNLHNNTEAEMAYARLNIVPSELFKDLIISEFHPVAGAEPPVLRPPSKTFVRRSIFRFSAKSAVGKQLRWKAEQSIEPKLQPKLFSRNQLLNEGVEIFANRSPFSTDILHEYFVPPEKGSAFIKAAGTCILRHEANLINVTVRSIEEDADTHLRYAPDRRLAFVMLFHQRRSQKADQAMQRLTRDLIEIALDLGGTYYLPYRLHATAEQFDRAYPSAREFFQLKRRHDPDQLFQNQFYQKYGRQ